MIHTIVVFEDDGWQRLLPLVYTRPCQELKCGTGSLMTRIERLARGCLVHSWCRPAIAALAAECTTHPVNQRPGGLRTLLLNGRGLWNCIPDYEEGDGNWVGVTAAGDLACICADAALAARLRPEVMLDPMQRDAALVGLPRRNVDTYVRLFAWHWQIVLANPGALRQDWTLFNPGAAVLGRVDEGVHLLGRDAIHIGEGTRIKPCVVIDAEDGPVHIGRNVKIMPHSYIQGPAYIGDNTLLQTGAVVREGTTIGPVCKVGGEIEGSIIHGYSNKQHDGFLGHSYLGEWINIAADCINSDLKNTYGTVRVPINGTNVETGELFVGMVVGDHSKIGINVSIPTGAVIGYASSVFDPACPKFVPSFMWVESHQATPYAWERVVEVARRVMARRRRDLTPALEAAMRHALDTAHRLEQRDDFIAAGNGMALAGARG